MRSSDGIPGVGTKRSVRQRHAQQWVLVPGANPLRGACTTTGIHTGSWETIALSEAAKEPMTNWPGLTDRTALPTSSTMPQYS